MAMQKAGRIQLALTIAADLGSMFLQPGFAGPNLTVDGLEGIIARHVAMHANLNCVHKKHVPEMQELAQDFFERHFKPLYVLYFKPPAPKVDEANP